MQRETRKPRLFHSGVAAGTGAMLLAFAAQLAVAGEPEAAPMCTGEVREAEIDMRASVTAPMPTDMPVATTHAVATSRTGLTREPLGYAAAAILIALAVWPKPARTMEDV